MNAIIIGDRFQKRMKSKGCSALIKCGSKTIIDLQYKYIKKYFPKSKIVYISGFDSKKFSIYVNSRKDKYKDLTIVNNDNYLEYNYVYSLSLAHDYMDDDSLIFFGDTIFSNNTLKKLNHNNGSQILLQKTKNDLGCIINDGLVKNIAYDLDNHLSNIYYVSTQDTKILKQIISGSTIYQNCFLFEIINLLIENDIAFKPLFIG